MQQHQKSVTNNFVLQRLIRHEPLWYYSFLATNASWSSLNELTLPETGHRVCSKGKEPPVAQTLKTRKKVPLAFEGRKYLLSDRAEARTNN
jgi:hypothetical protein